MEFENYFRLLYKDIFLAFYVKKKRIANLSYFASINTLCMLSTIEM